MTKKRIIIDEVYTFEMPGFSERSKMICVKISPELDDYLKNTAEYVGTKKNDLINHFIFDGIKNCGGVIKNKYGYCGVDGEGIPILGDVVERVLKFVVPYTKKKRRWRG